MLGYSWDGKKNCVYPTRIIIRVEIKDAIMDSTRYLRRMGQSFGANQTNRNNGGDRNTTKYHHNKAYSNEPANFPDHRDETPSDDRGKHLSDFQQYLSHANVVINAKRMI